MTKNDRTSMNMSGIEPLSSLSIKLDDCAMSVLQLVRLTKVVTSWLPLKRSLSERSVAIQSNCPMTIDDVPLSSSSSLSSKALSGMVMHDILVPLITWCVPHSSRPCRIKIPSVPLHVSLNGDASLTRDLLARYGKYIPSRLQLLVGSTKIEEPQRS
jgi:hypothetical protein